MKFAPPTASQRSAAAGPVDDLPEPFRRALEAGEHFQPLPAPGPADWLANHPESGQTFEEFVRSHPNRPDQQRRKLYLEPIGSFRHSGAPALDQLLHFTAAFFAMPALLLPPIDLKLERAGVRRNPATGQIQLRTTDLLALLRQRLPGDAFALVGITMIDLYPDPRWNFVFGQASPHERVGVYSFARYSPEFYGDRAAGDARSLVLRRSVKVLAHETCHLFGMAHCIWYRCVMNGSNHLAEADARPLHLCPVDLRKLQWSIGFDVAARYRRLLEFYAQAGFFDEAAWIESRLQFIEAK